MTDSAEFDWLVNWLSAHKPPAATMPTGDLTGVNYIDSGMVDSVSMIDLITDIENEFHTRFAGSHFSDPRFPLIGGLAEIIGAIKDDR